MGIFHGTSMVPSMDFPWNCHVSVISVVQFYESTEVAVIFRQSAAFFCCCWRCVISWTSTGLEEKWCTTRKWEWDASCWRKCSSAFFQCRHPSVIKAGSALPIHGSVLSLHTEEQKKQRICCFSTLKCSHARKLLIPVILKVQLVFFDNFWQGIIFATIPDEAAATSCSQ